MNLAYTAYDVMLNAGVFIKNIEEGNSASDATDGKESKLFIEISDNG